MSELTHRHINMFFHDLTSLGGVLVYCLISLFFLLLKNIKTFLILMLGFILIYAITALIRYFYFKERPIKYTHGNVLERLDASSFPSLHAARAGFLYALLIVFFNNLFFTIIFILIILGVMYSRMHLKKHDLKDVVAGVFIGVLLYFVISYFV